MSANTNEVVMRDARASNPDDPLDKLISLGEEELKGINNASSEWRDGVLLREYKKEKATAEVPKPLDPSQEEGGLTKGPEPLGPAREKGEPIKEPPKKKKANRCQYHFPNKECMAADPTLKNWGRFIPLLSPEAILAAATLINQQFSEIVKSFISKNN
ncbi:hypothetical protein COCVIDRAFT_16652 [Bipolaris victoriae FI3]|uniref:Uncharacterized protein n=1 Tax=Bipolaris victoriae (strain FI3) TaxID=930091 RepID=W7EDK7_BIPV3|nr:hypothetical protein COCVIDRAFT_16652 [Bipolaris victoriae FI3]